MPGENLEVGVIGAGYVGLATAACLAHLGNRVMCLDKDQQRLRSLRQGHIPFYEPGLEELLSRTVRAGRLSFAGTEGLAEVVRNADVVFIAVGTPQGDNGSADLSNVASVARQIGHALAQCAPRERPLVVVNKSTVPVGSGDYVSGLIREGAAQSGGSTNGSLVVSNPEFLREGSALYDTLFPDRIVVGADSREPLESMRRLYEPIIEQSFPTQLDPRPKATVPFVATDLASAEMIKYAANAFLATKISFINEISNLCELTGADVGMVASGIGLDGRIGPRFLNPGIGWGGSCLPKDVSALRAAARGYEHQTPLLDATVTVNEHQRGRVIEKLQRDLQPLEGKHIALLGLSFKPQTDDLRGTPSLKIARTLNALGARVVGYDPVAGKTAAKLVADLRVVYDPYEAIDGAHAVVVVTEWEEIRVLEPKRVASLMREPKLVVDGRNALEPASWEEAGLLYRGFGRG